MDVLIALNHTVEWPNIQRKTDKQSLNTKRIGHTWAESEINWKQTMSVTVTHHQLPFTPAVRGPHSVPQSLLQKGHPTPHQARPHILLQLDLEDLVLSGRQQGEAGFSQDQGQERQSSQEHNQGCVQGHAFKKTNTVRNMQFDQMANPFWCS